MSDSNGKPKRGFAALPPEVRHAISSKGGKTAHAHGTAHKFTSAEGRIAGAKGGQACHRKRRERLAEETKASNEMVSKSMFDPRDDAETIPAPPLEEASDG